MSTPITPRTEESPGGPSYPLPLADEESLRRVFDETFPSLVEEARSQLGDAPHLAQRVVEGAFVCAWQEREELRGPSQLRSYLSNEVHKGAVRALSRREAARHMGGSAAATGSHAARPHDTASHATPPNADEAWAHIERSIHHAGHSPEAAAEALAHSRHGAAEHVASINKPTPWKTIIGIGVAAALVIVLGSRWVGARGQDAMVQRAVNAPDARLVQSAPGRGAVVTLNDGTKVTLAPDSRLSIPKDFGPEMRAVKLDGAGTFEPKTGEAKPLLVFVRNAVVESGGGTFSARGWADDPSAAVRVRSGDATLRVGDASRPLATGQAMAVAGDGAVQPLDGAALVASMGWTDDSLVVTNQPLRAVLPVLQRWYGMDLKVPDSTLLARVVSFRAPLSSSRLAVQGIEQSAGVQYGYAGQDLALRDARAGAPRP